MKKIFTKWLRCSTEENATETYDDLKKATQKF